MARRLQGFYRRMDHGITGHFLTPEEVEQMGSVPIALAIARLPYANAKMVPGSGTYRIEVKRCNSYWHSQDNPRAYYHPHVFLDGALIYRPGDPPSEFLSMSTSEIAAIEMYTGPAQMPAEFGRLDVVCAIGIWTR